MLTLADAVILDGIFLYFLARADGLGGPKDAGLVSERSRTIENAFDYFHSLYNMVLLLGNTLGIDSTSSTRVSVRSWIQL